MTREERRERVARAIARVAIRRALNQILAAHLQRGEASEAQVEREAEKAWPQHLDAADAALATLDAIMVEEGMVVVPAEATEEMLAVGVNERRFGKTRSVADIYRAMIGAFERAT